MDDEREFERSQSDPTYAYRRGREAMKREALTRLRDLRQLLDADAPDEAFGVVQASAAIASLETGL